MKVKASFKQNKILWIYT